MKKNKTILIIEDDDDIREMMIDLVTQHGYEPKSARNGQEALDILNDFNCDDPCLIFLDWAMPLMSGKEFLKMRRKSDVIVPIPTVIVSATPPGKLPLGATKILRKPVDLELLFQDIDKYCGEALAGKVMASAQIIGKKVVPAAYKQDLTDED